MTMALGNRHQDKLTPDRTSFVGNPYQSHETTYSSQYGRQTQSSRENIGKDLVPFLLRKHVLPGNGNMPRLWRETLQRYKQASCPDDGNLPRDRVDYTQSYHRPSIERTRHSSRFEKSRLPVSLAIPPQQLDRDPAVVFDRHMPDSREGRLKSANFYTAVTRRSNSGSVVPTFDALNRQMVPVPQLMDKEAPKAAGYNKVSITPWRNQVTKVVPERLAVSIPASGPRSQTNNDNVFRLDYLRMPETTFLPVDRAQPKRHYIINPEWYSERPNMNFVKPGHGPLSW